MTTRTTANKIQQMSREFDPDRVLEAFLKAGWKILKHFPQSGVIAIHPTCEDYSLALTDRWALIGRKQLSTGGKLWCFPDEGAIVILESLREQEALVREKYRVAIQKILCAADLDGEFDDLLFPGLCKVFSGNRKLCEIIIQTTGIMVICEEPSVVTDNLKESLLKVVEGIIKDVPPEWADLGPVLTLFPEEKESETGQEPIKGFSPSDDNEGKYTTRQ